jgi:hypothetical protein
MHSTAKETPMAGPWIRRIRCRAAVPFSLAVATVLALPAALPGPAQAAGAPAATSPQEIQEAQRAAVTDLRNVGTAMYVWFKDHATAGQGGSQDHGASQQGDSHQGDSEKETVDVTEVPLISYADLKGLLVPKYIAELPVLDPWGQPYEYRLNREPAATQRVMAVRSGGADGRFTGNAYAIGAFPPGDAEQDLVWVDGYFVRWPQRPGS